MRAPRTPTRSPSSPTCCPRRRTAGPGLDVVDEQDVRAAVARPREVATRSVVAAVVATVMIFVVPVFNISSLGNELLALTVPAGGEHRLKTADGKDRTIHEYSSVNLEKDSTICLSGSGQIVIRIDKLATDGSVAIKRCADSSGSADRSLSLDLTVRDASDMTGRLWVDGNGDPGGHGTPFSRATGRDEHMRLYWDKWRPRMHTVDPEPGQSAGRGENRSPGERME